MLLKKEGNGLVPSCINPTNEGFRFALCNLGHPSTVATRETGEGWPLLTVETEVNGDSKSTNERGPSLVGSLGLSCQYKRFLFCLGCYCRPSTKYLFPYRTLFQFLCPHRPASWTGSRAAFYSRLVFVYLRRDVRSCKLVLLWPNVWGVWGLYKNILFFFILFSSEFNGRKEALFHWKSGIFLIYLVFLVVQAFFIMNFTLVS